MSPYIPDLRRTEMKRDRERERLRNNLNWKIREEEYTVEAVAVDRIFSAVPSHFGFALKLAPDQNIVRK